MKIESAYDALQNEYPPPTGLARQPVHLHQTVCQDATKCKSDTADNIESEISLSNVI